ncbi:MAG: hypothetical protein ACR2MB_01010 [Acidimicrobiales bacterium]
MSDDVIPDPEPKEIDEKLDRAAAPLGERRTEGPALGPVTG